MNYLVIILIAAALVIFELLHEITSSIFKIIFLIAKVVLILFEYVVLYRIWIENGLFVKIAVPMSFLVFLILQILSFRKCKEKGRLRKALLSSIIIGTPIFSFATTYFIAQLFQINIKFVLDMIDLTPIIKLIKKVNIGQHGNSA